MLVPTQYVASTRFRPPNCGKQVGGSLTSQMGEAARLRLLDMARSMSAEDNSTSCLPVCLPEASESPHRLVCAKLCRRRQRQAEAEADQGSYAQLADRENSSQATSSASTATSTSVLGPCSGVSSRYSKADSSASSTWDSSVSTISQLTPARHLRFVGYLSWFI